MQNVYSGNIHCGGIIDVEEGDNVGREYTDAQKRASVKYMHEKTDDIRLRVPKGTKVRWMAAAEQAGMSMTKFVQDAVEKMIDRGN